MEKRKAVSEMREILFRGKNDRGEWIEGFYIKDAIETYIYDKYRNTRMQSVLPETIGQYTGLTDKNGKKIFEGDIVRYGDTVHEAVFEQRNGTAYFGLVYNPLETLPFGHYQDLRQIEVIGNIHDNPESLKGE